MPAAGPFEETNGEAPDAGAQMRSCNRPRAIEIVADR